MIAGGSMLLPKPPVFSIGRSNDTSTGPARMADDLAPTDLPDLLTAADHEDANHLLESLRDRPAEDRKTAIAALEPIAEETPEDLEPILSQVATYLTDDDRAVRLRTAKLLVTVAKRAPGVVRPVRAAVADRLADDGEFYYVRARAAETIGFLARDFPEDAATPAVLADLKLGLEFDEPEVREKLAKALEHVALGEPTRLAHHVDDLAEHLTDDNDRVRYHLLTALTVVACTDPAAVEVARARIVDRLDDGNRYVRGRAAEALGLLASASSEAEPIPVVELRALGDDEAFVAERARFAVDAARAADGHEDSDEDGSVEADAIGTVEGIREDTEAILEELTAPAGDDGCPHCGLGLPSAGPPVCPRCGGPL